MTEFRCKKCSQKFDAEGTYLHVFEFDHGSVIDMQTNKDLHCENCNEADVKKLQILKFGSGNWYLFCLQCSDRKDSTNVVEFYSANDGKPWKMWKEFLDVKDAMKPDSEKLLEEYHVLSSQFTSLKDRINRELENRQPNSKQTQYFFRTSNKRLEELYSHLEQLKLRSQFNDDKDSNFGVMISDTILN